MDYHREHTVARGWRQTQVSLHCRINLSPFTKDFRGGELLRVNCIFGHLLTAELQWNVKSKENLTVYQQAVEGCAAGHFSVFAAFAVPVSSLHIYLASLEDRAFLYVMGSKHWRWSCVGHFLYLLFLRRAFIFI